MKKNMIELHINEIENIKLKAKREVIEFDNDEMFEHIKHLAVHDYNFYDNAHFIMRIIKKELNKRHLSTFDNPKVEESFRNLKKIVKENKIDVMKLFEK